MKNTILLRIRAITVLALFFGGAYGLSGSALAQESTPNDNPQPDRSGSVSIQSATVSNGVVQIGVHDFGNLIDGTNGIGLVYVPTGGEGISPGCWCEGYGVGDATSMAAGWASWDNGGFTNVSLVDFTSTPTTATSVVDVAGTLRVTHDFYPSPDTPFLYEVLVTMENISPNPVEPRYRRAMDWDVPPTPFWEYVTIETGTSSALLYSSDNGFAFVDPFGGPSYILFEGEAVDSGPQDHGALFDYAFDSLAPGESESFYIYYGAAGTEAEALTALATVQAEVYSLGQPSSDGGRTLGEPNTFIFGFKGVQGDPVFPEIDVKGNGVSIEDGDVTPSADDDTDFGSAVPSDGSTVDKSFLIENLGSTDLTVSEVSITGANAGDFSFSGIVLPATIGLGESMGFTITFDPSALGLRTATVNITNTDADENPYDFAIQGMGNSPPVAEDDEYTLAQDSVDNLLEVLANDSDADSDPLTISAVGDPAHGTVVNQDTELLYTPESGYTGEDSFEYTVSDGHGGTDVGLVTIKVTAANIPPVAQDDEYTLAQDSVDNLLEVLANDSDADSDPLTINAVDDPPNGSVVNQGTQLLYTPDPGYTGEDSFEYTVSDGQGGTDTGLVTITVTQSGNVVYLPIMLKNGLGPLYKYTEDFEDGTGDEWSDQGIATAPNGQGFLGEFGNQTIGLTLDDLPEHDQVKVSFDLYILRSWDGNSTAIGPDIWGFSLVDQPPVLQTTFSNGSFYTQAYPDQYPDGVNPDQTGAVAVNTLGYAYQSIPLDATYRVSFILDHTGSTLELEFFAEGLQPLQDESWGLDNVEVVITR